MSKTPLVLKALHVDRLYGRRHDDIRVEGLTAGINVVHGPNGQGKTTLGRGLHALVWPGSVTPHRPALSGTFLLGDDEWRVDLDGPTVRYQRGGVESPPPPLAEDDERDRYRLSLHHLLTSDGKGFARVVARDAAGGLDLGEATAALKFTSGTPRSSSATREAKEAWEALDAERRAQQELASEAAALDDLACQQAEATAAASLRELWEAAREYATIRDEAAGAQAALDALPAALADTRGDDADTLRSLRDAVRDASTREGFAQQEARAAEATLADNVVARFDAPPPLPELRTLHETVREADHAVATRDADLEGLRRQEASEAARFPGADLDRLVAVSLDDVAALDDHARQSARLMGFREELAAFMRVEKELSETLPKETLEDAARLLRDWLRLQQASPSPHLLRLAVAAAAVCALVGVGLGLIVHPVGFVLLLGTLGLAIVALQLRPGTDGRLTDVQARIQRLDLPTPPWTPDGVERALESAERGRADAVLAAQIRTRAAARRDGLAGVAQLQAQVEAQGARLADRLGLSVKVDGIELAHAVEGIRAYQQARTRREAVEASRAASLAKRAAALGQASTLLAPYGLSPVQDLPALAAAVARLEAADREAAEARSDLQTARQTLETVEREKATATQAIEALFERLGLDPADGDEAVADACRQREAYLAAARAATDAQAQAEAALRRLRNHPDYTEAHEDVSPEHAAAERAAAAARAAQAESLTEQVTELRTRIRQAEAAHALETAAARHAATLDALRDERDQAVAARLGDLFAKAAAKTSRERQVPAVVRRAGEILGSITAHRYGLSFDPETACFVAIDHVLDQGLALDELSSGTRVQLLLSVRIAFIEQRERGVRLPLVLDELLANSDEERAEAITQSVVALCRDGRQVVYLTSQPDEVAKWRRIAETCDDVDCAFFALGGAPSGDGASDPDALPHLSLADPVPAPDGLDHAAYGARLGVPRWTARDDVGALHLWYAVDDPAALYATLQSGVTCLGPALAAIRAGAGTAIGISDPERFAVFGDALAAWQAAWQHGRGRPVDRDVLEASGAITPVFMDRVADLAARLGGDAGTLLEALRNKELDRFRQSSADDLEEYLLGHGYLDASPILSDDDIWARVISRVGTTCASEAVPLRAVRAMLGRIAAGPPSPTDSANRV